MGRFQPFHLGHLEAIKWILEKCEEVAIVIGSSQESFTLRNPFTFEERKELIENSLEDEGVEQARYAIAAVSDVFDCERWVKSILGKAKFDVVYTRSLWVKECFDLFKIPVRNHPMFGRYSARDIRKRMDEDVAWEDLVPWTVGQSIKGIRGAERLRNLAKAEDASRTST